MNLFEGETRKKPLQSLRGASQSLNKGCLLDKAHSERRDRQALRLQNLSAQKIQACFRGHLTRRRKKIELLALFQTTLKNLNNGENVEKNFLLCLKYLFYNFCATQDYNEFLKLQKTFLKLVTQNNYNPFNLFVNNIHFMVKFFEASLNLLKIRQYYPFKSFELLNCQSDINKLTEFYSKMTQKAYFENLLNFIANKLPSMQEPQEFFLLPQDIKYAIELIFYPLYCIKLLTPESYIKSQSNAILETFCIKVLGSPLTLFANNTAFVFPYIFANLSSNNFPFDKLLQYILYFSHNFLLEKCDNLCLLTNFLNLYLTHLLSKYNFMDNLPTLIPVLSNLLKTLLLHPQFTFLKSNMITNKKNQHENNEDTMEDSINNSYNTDSDSYYDYAYEIEDSDLSDMVASSPTPQSNTFAPSIDNTTKTGHTTLKSRKKIKEFTQILSNHSYRTISRLALYKTIRYLLNAPAFVDEFNRYIVLENFHSTTSYQNKAYFYSIITIAYSCLYLTIYVNSSPKSSNSWMVFNIDNKNNINRCNYHANNQSINVSTDFKDLLQTITFSQKKLPIFTDHKGWQKPATETVNYRQRMDVDDDDVTILINDSLLLRIAYNYTFVHTLWSDIKEQLLATNFGGLRTSLHKLFETPYLETALNDSNDNNNDPFKYLAQDLELYCFLINITLTTIQDSEIYQIITLKTSHAQLLNKDRETLIRDLIEVIRLIKRLVLSILDYLMPLNFTIMIKKDHLKFYQSRALWVKLFKVCTSLLRKLYLRNSRLEFTDGKIWVYENSSVWDQMKKLDAESFNKYFSGPDSKDPLALFCVVEKLSARKWLHNLHDSDIPTENTSLDLLILSDSKLLKCITLLKHAYFTLPFTARVQLFNSLYLDFEKSVTYSSLNHRRLLLSEWQQSHGSTIDVNIRRQYIYEDSFEKLSPTNEPNLKLKMRVRLINRAGAEEAGIDGGGVFREYLSQLLLSGFDANRGLFKHSFVPKATSSPNTIGGLSSENSYSMVEEETQLIIFPNPDVYAYFGFFSDDPVENKRETLKHYYFLGRILGKAIYENLLVELPLAHFFLSKILQICHNEIMEEHLEQEQDNVDCNTNTVQSVSVLNTLESYGNIDLNDLRSIDPILYKNLMYLINYPNPEEIPEVFQLDFSVLEERFGQIQKVDLINSGSNIIVNATNRLQYVYLLADYKLNKQLDAASKSFARGLMNLVDPSWLTLFSPAELRILICGTPEPINIEDWMKNTVYSGGYTEHDPVIKNFWHILFQDLDDSQRSKLLKFVTSCSRPPLLGFKELNPAFCIQKSVTSSPSAQHMLNDETYSDVPSTSPLSNNKSLSNVIDQLPTASTCMNLLKLPPFATRQIMKAKILYAINSMAGFELS